MGVRNPIERPGDFIRWTEEPDLELPALVGVCEVTLRRGPLTVVMHTKKRISEVMEVCGKRFG